MGIGSAALLYAAVTALFFRNLLPDLTTHLYSDLGDPLLNAAILAWNAQQLPLTDAWWNFPSYAPVTGVTAFHEHLLLTYPLASPIIWATGNPILAYNVVFLLSPVLNGIATYALVRELTQSRVASFIGGLAFAFAPYQAVQLSHIQETMSFGMPMALLGLHRYTSGGGRRALGFFGVGWFITTLSNAEMLVCFPVVVVLWCLWFIRPREWRRLVPIVITAAVAALPLVPLLWGYHVRHVAYGFVREYDAIRSVSADIAGLVHMSYRSMAWRGILPHDAGEGALFPGFTVVALAVFAVLSRRTGPADAWERRDPVIFYAIAVVTLWLLALPGFDGLRLPARTWLPAVFCLAVLAGCAFATMLERYVRHRRILVACVVMAILYEGNIYDQTHRVPRPIGTERLP